jgi:hypothetical protein
MHECRIYLQCWTCTIERAKDRCLMHVIKTVKCSQFNYLEVIKSNLQETWQYQTELWKRRAYACMPILILVDSQSALSQ